MSDSEFGAIVLDERIYPIERMFLSGAEFVSVITMSGETYKTLGEKTLYAAFGVDGIQAYLGVFTKKHVSGLADSDVVRVSLGLSIEERLTTKARILLGVAGV